VIEVRDLVRKFGPFTALDGISFELERGEVVGFLGVNGAGKTTTMRILTGYLPATTGSVRVAGFDVLRQSMEVRKRIGYLPESVPLYREHRVEEMMRFQARLHGMTRADAKRRTGDVLERVDLLDRARTPVGKLSKGLRQRVGIAVALLPNPEVLILDEPTSGLDPMQRVAVRELLKSLAADHTVLLSSHILPEVEAVAPRMIIIHRGRIAAAGTRAELVEQLGSGTHVRVEAFVGPAVADAIRLFESIEGVSRVHDRGKLGIHHQFEVECETDLREDVGAMAAAKGWALRELSWHAPELEQLFSRVALELGSHDPAEPQGGQPAPGAEAPPAPAIEAGPGLLSLSVSGPDDDAPASTPPPAADAAPKRIVYNLNPFDQGADRDLGKPKSTDS